MDSVEARKKKLIDLQRNVDCIIVAIQSMSVALQQLRQIKARTTNGFERKAFDEDIAKIIQATDRLRKKHEEARKKLATLKESIPPQSKP